MTNLSLCFWIFLLQTCLYATGNEIEVNSTTLSSSAVGTILKFPSDNVPSMVIYPISEATNFIDLKWVSINEITQNATWIRDIVPPGFTSNVSFTSDRPDSEKPVVTVIFDAQVSGFGPEARFGIIHELFGEAKEITFRGVPFSVLAGTTKISIVIKRIPLLDPTHRLQMKLKMNGNVPLSLKPSNTGSSEGNNSTMHIFSSDFVNGTKLVVISKLLHLAYVDGKLVKGSGDENKGADGGLWSFYNQTEGVFCFRFPSFTSELIYDPDFSLLVENDDNSPFPYWIIAIIVGVLLLIVISIGTFLLLRHRGWFGRFRRSWHKFFRTRSPSRSSSLVPNQKNSIYV